MKKRIQRISPLQLGKISAAIYGFFSLLFVPFIIISAVFSKQAHDPGSMAQ